MRKSTSAVCYRTSHCCLIMHWLAGCSNIVRSSPARVLLFENLFANYVLYTLYIGIHEFCTHFNYYMKFNHRSVRAIGVAKRAFDCILSATYNFHRIDNWVVNSITLCIACIYLCFIVVTTRNNFYGRPSHMDLLCTQLNAQNIRR